MTADLSNYRRRISTEVRIEPIIGSMMRMVLRIEIENEK